MPSPDAPELSERSRENDSNVAPNESERRLRIEAEARASDLADRARLAQEELSLHFAGVRYRLGHAIILALKPSRHTIALPWRLVGLFMDGLRRWRHRRRSRVQTIRPPRAQSTGSGVDPEIDRTLSAGTSGVPESPFAPVPQELIRRPKLRVAAILDEFSWRCWQYEADFHAITPSNWRAVFAAGRPDLLLIESAWSGLNGSWQERLLYIDRWRRLWMRPVIDEILAWCRRHGVPTVFHSKEDPTHFEAFLDLARACDFVFTCDADSVDGYCKRLGHSRVGVLPFAAQPRIHNPIMDGLERTRNVFFAGTWYAAHHSQRQRDAETLLRPAMDFGLDIFSRLDETAPPEYRWPEEYHLSLRGTLPYARMLLAYRLYRVGLNLNSIVYSSTMVSRRMFELLACGTPVVSSHARGISELFDEDVVLVASDAQATRQHIGGLLQNGSAWERLSLQGTRRVFGSHTYSHRMRGVLEALKLGDATTLDPTVAMLAPVENAHDIESAYANFARQEYASRRLVLCTSDSDLLKRDSKPTSDPRVESVNLEAPWGRVLHEGIRRCSDQWVALLCPRDYYGPHYLTDYVHATQYVRGKVMGKGQYSRLDAMDRLSRVEGRAAHAHESEVAPWSFFVAKDVLAERMPASDSAVSAEEWITHVATRLPPAYSTDPFNYVRVANEFHPTSSPSQAGHWSLSDPSPAIA